MIVKSRNALILCGFLSLVTFSCTDHGNTLEIDPGDHVVLIGNNLCSRMMNFGHFETELHLRHPMDQLTIRNMCDGGNTPGFRPHSGRVTPWAFPGAEIYQTEFAENSGSQGHFEYPDEWLTRLKADVILAFFGYSESFKGSEGLDLWKDELGAFVDHTLKQQYNGTSTPALVLVSPIAFEDLSMKKDLPNGAKENENLSIYTEGMREVAAEKEVLFIDLFTPSKQWFEESAKPLTRDGFQLGDEGYKILSEYLADQIFGPKKVSDTPNRDLVHSAVLEKNWFWHNDFKIPNGVHVFGRRYNPFGPDNYPFELQKIREMTAIRDTAIWEAIRGQQKDLAAADAKTSILPPVETNYKPSEKNGSERYLYGEEALAKLRTAPGYNIELFASEKEFPDLANPVQLSFDNQGRLWVGVMPSYPHYRPGDTKPNDKLLILEDTDGDYKADKQTVFVDGLHLTIGFEFAPEGVYVSQGTNLKLYTDTDGDDQADEEKIILSGFDDHDTHHAISAFVTDPSGAIYMGEGVFLHTNVETPYGTVRGTNGGFYRFSPQRNRLERTAQLAIPNPWGIAFDEWGQHFFAETSGPDMRWMVPGSVKPRYGVATHKSYNLIEDAHRVRPTSGLEFVYSRHFPDEVQGDILINNTIGFLGTKMHTMEDDGTGYKSRHRLDLVVGSDKNFRPVDMEFAPDGSLYLVDWHNILIGHMQHNARDPLRDHSHGRIYRITYPSRPLLKPAEVHNASLATLFENLKLPEFRTRYRTRRELRGRTTEEVMSYLQSWVKDLDPDDPRYQHHLLEALWVSWGANKVDEVLLRKLLDSEDHKVRAAAVKVLRYMGHQIEGRSNLLTKAASDPHGRVRLEAIIAASWLNPDIGIPIVEEAGQHEMDDWIVHAYETALAHLNGHKVDDAPTEKPRTHLVDQAERDLYFAGLEIYERDGFCATCHQKDGSGLEASGFPPLAGARWVTQNEDRLIKIALNGLHGPIEVLGKEYPGQVPMTPYGAILNDEEIAAVLTYIRNAFGNTSSVITPEKVKEVRAANSKEGFYSPDELLAEHPHEDEVQ